MEAHPGPSGQLEPVLRRPKGVHVKGEQPLRVIVLGLVILPQLRVSEPMALVAATKLACTRCKRDCNVCRQRRTYVRCYTKLPFPVVHDG